MSAVLDRYVALFDEDFLKVPSKPSAKPDPMSALKLSAPKQKKLPKPKEAKENASGWGDEALTKNMNSVSYQIKPISEWNSHDFRRYVSNAYFKRWGEYVKGYGQFALNNEIVLKIEHNLRTQIGKDGYGILKEYFDWFIDNQVESASQSGGGMSWSKFSYSKYVISFVKHWKDSQIIKPANPLSKPEEPNKQIINTETLSIDGIQTAFRISPQVFVKRYGLVIPVNYLVMMRKQSVDKATEYVRIAVNKICSESSTAIREIFETTKRYQPYPKWFSANIDNLLNEFAEKFSNEKLILSYADDNSDFGFMRNIA